MTNRRRKPQNRKTAALTIPAADLRAVCGIGMARFRELERRGCPFNGAEDVDICKALAWALDELQRSENDGGAVVIGGSLKDTLTAEQIEKTRLANEKQRLAIEKTRDNLVPKNDATKVLWAIADIYREAGERLGAAYGRDAQDIILEAVDEIGRQIDAFNAIQNVDFAP